MSKNLVTGPEEKVRQILTWIGVSQQLLETRINRALKGTELSYAQLAMLNHFGAFPGESWTITRLAGAFEIGQPGVSKTVRRLVDKGYLRVEPDPEDGRVKFHHLTEQGKARYDEALRRLLPEGWLIFGQWNIEDIDTLHARLFQLKTWLDENRETRADGVGTASRDS